MALQVEWIKCNDGKNWCGLLDVNLNHEHFNNIEGVYIIWHGGQNPATVRVGQGNIKERLSAHRQDKDILAFQQYGLWATWSRVVANQRDGVERYLAERLHPKIGSRFPEVVRPIEVNLPW